MRKQIIFIGFSSNEFFPHATAIELGSGHGIICCNFPTFELAIAAMQGEDLLELVIAFVIFNDDSKMETIEVIDTIVKAIPAENAKIFSELPKIIFSHENIKKELLDRKCLCTISMESTPEELWDVVKLL